MMTMMTQAWIQDSMVQDPDQEQDSGPQDQDRDQHSHVREKQRIDMTYNANYTII